VRISVGIRDPEVWGTVVRSEVCIRAAAVTAALQIVAWAAASTVVAASAVAGAVASAVVAAAFVEAEADAVAEEDAADNTDIGKIVGRTTAPV
jgi:hypothetical protein